MIRRFIVQLLSETNSISPEYGVSVFFLLEMANARIAAIISPSARVTVPAIFCGLMNPFAAVSSDASFSISTEQSMPPVSSYTGTQAAVTAPNVSLLVMLSVNPDSFSPEETASVSSAMSDPNCCLETGSQVQNNRCLRQDLHHTVSRRGRECRCRCGTAGRLPCICRQT